MDHPFGHVTPMCDEEGAGCSAPSLTEPFTEDWEESARLKVQEQHTFVFLPLFQLALTQAVSVCFGDLWRSLSVNHPRHTHTHTARAV